eukprot:4312958-Pleurochrysis_carterae.AAC.5
MPGDDTGRMGAGRSGRGHAVIRKACMRDHTNMHKDEPEVSNFCARFVRASLHAWTPAGTPPRSSELSTPAQQKTANMDKSPRTIHTCADALNLRKAGHQSPVKHQIIRATCSLNTHTRRAHA